MILLRVKSTARSWTSKGTLSEIDLTPSEKLHKTLSDTYPDYKITFKMGPGTFDTIEIRAILTEEQEEEFLFFLKLYTDEEPIIIPELYAAELKRK